MYTESFASAHPRNEFQLKTGSLLQLKHEIKHL